MELLGKARLSVWPAIDSGYVNITNGVETSYKVEKVKLECLHRNVAEFTGYVDGVPQYGEYVADDLADVGLVVIVSPE